MKNNIICLLCILLIALLANGVIGSEKNTASPDTTKNALPALKVKEVKFFTKASTIQDYAGKVSEYEVLEKGARSGMSMSVVGKSDNAFIEMNGVFNNSQDQSYNAKMDVNKSIKSEVSFDKMRHWLDHDPIENVREVPGLPPARKVYTKDLDASADYNINRSVAQGKFSYQIPTLPEFTGRVSFRQEQRQGTDQAIAFNMCQSCHVSSQGKRIDQVTQTYQAGVTYKKGKLTADYSFTYRNFKENAPAPTIFYEGPSTNPDPEFFDTWKTAPQSYFDKRNFNDAELPYSFVPNSEKTSHTVKASLQLLRRSNLTVVGTYSANQNKHNRAWLKYQGVSSYFNTVLADKLTMHLKYQYQNIDNDDIESAQLAAMTASLLPNDPYFSAEKLYNSALSRTTNEGEVSLVYRLGRKSSLGLGWNMELINRKNFLLEKTTKNTFNGFIQSQLSKSLNAKVEYIGSWIDDPFVNYLGGMEPVADSAYLNVVYSNFLKNLRNPLTSSPERIDRARLRLKFAPGAKINLSLQGEYNHSVNDQTGWKADYLTPTFNFNYLPSEKTMVSLNYSYQYGRTKTIFTTPVILLKAGELQYSYGSLNKLIPYDEDIQSFGVGFSRQLSDRLSWNTFGTYLMSQGEYNTETFKGHPTGSEEEYVDMSDLNAYGKHKYRQLYLTTTLDYRLMNGVYLTGELGYYDFNNPIIYLFDADGSAFFTNVGISIRAF